MNITAPMIRPVLNLNGYAIACAKSPKPKPSPIAAVYVAVATRAASNFVSDSHIAPQYGHIFTVPPYDVGHALQKWLKHVPQMYVAERSACIEHIGVPMRTGRSVKESPWY